MENKYQKTLQIFCVLFIYALVIVPQKALATTIPSPGFNLTHYRVNPNGQFHNRSIAWEYQEVGVRDFIKQNLSSMKAHGADAIRVFVPNMHNFNRLQTWGVIPSAQDKIPQEVATNLSLFFNDVRDSGISTLIVVFAPVGVNAPRSPDYNPEYIEENFRFIQNIRPIAQKNGPKNVYF